MVKRIAALVIAASAACSAQAAVVITATTAPGGYTGSAAAANVITFDGANPLNGFTLSGSGYQYNYGATPAGDTSANFLSVSSGAARLGNGSAYTALSFYWGTPDDYNFVDLYDAAGSLLGTVTKASAGIASDSIVNITSNTAFTTAAFRSSQAAFELDNVSFSGAVPEPASWMTMILGFGAIGFAMRRRRAPVAGGIEA